MKKILILVIVIVGVWFFFIKEGGNGTQIENTASTTPSSGFQPDAGSATFTFDEETVTLVNGQAETQDENGFSTETTILEETAVGDLNKDGKADRALLLARSGGGSGVFIYLAAYISGPVSYKGTNTVFIGDRISPESVSIKNGVVTLNYLDRGRDEPFASEPTIERSEEYVYVNGELQDK